MHKRKPSGLVNCVLILSLIFVNPFVSSQVYAEENSFFSSPVALGLGVGAIGVAVGTFLTSFLSKNNDIPDIPEGDLIVSSVHFDNPGSKDLIIYNSSEFYPVTVNSVEFDNDVKYITPGSLVDCNQISPKKLCRVKLTATKESYGVGKSIVKYSNSKRVASNDVTVSGVALDLLKSGATISEDKDIVLAPNKTEPKFPATHSYVLKNIGEFIWRANINEGKKITWKKPFDPGYVELKPDSTCLSKGDIEPGESCSFDLVYENEHPGDWGMLEFLGENLKKDYLKKVFLADGLGIGINLDPAANYLGYRSIKIFNGMQKNTEDYGDIWIKDISLSGSLLGDKMESVCPYGAADCVDGTTCKKLSTQGKSLGPEESCLVWFKAKEANSLQSEDSYITVIVDGQKKEQGGTWEDFSDYEKECVFKVKYENALYIGGGEFFKNSDYDISSTYLAKWDGSNFSNLGEHGLKGGPIYAITAMDGDLYFGGKFSRSSIPVNRVAKWDGSIFSALGDSNSGGGVNDSVFALISKDHNLYLGGEFESSDVTNIDTKKIAKWDGSAFSALGGGLDNSVRSFTFVEDDLYVGGGFDNAFSSGGKKVAIDKVAKWDKTNFSPLGDQIISKEYGLGFHVSALSYLADSQSLYVGGNFHDYPILIGSVLEYNLENQSYSYLNGSIEVLDDGVNALKSMESNTYIGGDFDTLYNGQGGTDWIDSRGVAKWDGTKFLALGDKGLGEDHRNEVYAFASVGAELYIGGWFIDDNISKNIIRWDTVKNSFSSLKAGYEIKDTIRALAVAPSITIVDGHRTN